jgi:hypothetical protein
MRFLKKFELFKEELVATQPQRSPSTKPAEPAVHPGTKPSTRPGRPSPIRRDKPAVEPDPKANKDKKELPTATIEEVIEKYAELTNQKI